MTRNIYIENIFLVCIIVACIIKCSSFILHVQIYNYLEYRKCKICDAVKKRKGYHFWIHSIYTCFNTFCVFNEINCTILKLWKIIKILTKGNR